MNGVSTYPVVSKSGSSSSAANALLPQNPSNGDYLKVLKTVIDDQNIPTVGGNIQFGSFAGRSFKVFGIAELGTGVHYWRGPIDLNSEELMADENFVTGLTMIDPFNTFAD
jgi:hypothetical protein